MMGSRLQQRPLAPPLQLTLGTPTPNVPLQGMVGPRLRRLELAAGSGGCELQERGTAFLWQLRGLTSLDLESCLGGWVGMRVVWLVSWAGVCWFKASV